MKLAVCKTICLVAFIHMKLYTWLFLRWVYTQVIMNYNINIFNSILHNVVTT